MRLSPQAVAAWRAWSAKAPHEALREFARDDLVSGEATCLACDRRFTFVVIRGHSNSIPDFCQRCLHVPTDRT